MATPLKPWERNGSGSSIPVSSNTPGNGDNRNRTSPMRPAIPPRPNSINSGLELQNLYLCYVILCDMK